RRKGGSTTGQQVSTSEAPVPRRSGAGMGEPDASPSARRRGPHEARAASGAGPRLYRLIEPEVGDGEQPGAAVDERQPCALAQGQLRLAQEALQRSPRPAGSYAQPLAAAAPADREPGGKRGEIDRAVLIGLELDLPEVARQGTD